MTREELQTIFESEFKWENWKKVMNFVFPEFKFNLVQTDLTRDTKAHKKSAGYIKEHGTTQLASPEMLTLCEILVNDTVRLDRNIKSVRSLVADLVVPNYQTVIAVFHNADNTKWRFTLVVKEFTGSNRVFDKKPDSYTYVFGVGEKGRTASERFLKLAGNPKKTLKDLEEAFSVEALSKKFFTEYKGVYQKFVNDIIENPSRLAMFKGSDREKSARDFVKKMMGRLVFLYFLQKKGWLGCKTKWQGGDEQFMKAFVDKAKQDDLFYHHYLEPLFFDTLNDKRTKQNEDCIIQKTNFGKVPYLNGGLFEKDENHPAALTLKWENFNSFFDTLNNYNFTIIEDDPEFKEVAVDPEMLGHIFENLLEDNKDKGAFYTPKEIVHYMCQESLYEYLKTNLEQNNYWPTAESEATMLEKALHNFVTQKTAGKVIDFDKPLAKALKEVKICDPAIGSGAFPMGLLNEIFHCVHVLYDASPDTVGPVWDMDSWQPNKVKLNIIQNSIYGVDIEKGAVDIARLRFWLSLIVDEPEPTALPNLDYKIVVGNSLVSKLGDNIIDIDWHANDTSHGLFGAELAENKKKLLQKISAEQKESFNPESDKKKLATDIRNLKIDLLINQLELMIRLANQDREPNATSFTDKKKFILATENYHRVLSWKAQVKRLGGIKQKQVDRLDFFDWKLDFPEIMNDQLVDKPGFDIVIGNPPYVRVQNLEYDLIDVYKLKYKTAWKRIDISTLFFELGSKLVKKNGIISYISSNQFITTEYGRLMRRFLIKEKLLNKIIDFGDLPIFEDALTYVSIFFLRQTFGEIFHYHKVNSLPFKYPDKLLAINTNILNDDVWSLGKNEDSQILRKMATNAERLDKKAKCWAGIITGNDNLLLYQIDKEIDDIEPELIVPVLRAQDCVRYGYARPSKKAFYPYIENGDKTEIIPLATLKSKYPKAYKFVISNKDLLKSRKDSRKVFGEKEGWYGLIRFGRLSRFKRLKIISPGEVKANKFTLDDTSSAFSCARVFSITSEDKNLQIKYLLAILNSKLAEFYFHRKAPLKQGGYYSYSASVIDAFPLKVMRQEALIAMVDKVIALIGKERETITYEKQIDVMVYKIYELTYDEVKVVEPNFILSKEEYDSQSI